MFLASQNGAATDEVWFIAIFAIGAVVGLLVVAFQFVVARRQSDDPLPNEARGLPDARNRYCTRCGEPLGDVRHACARQGESRAASRPDVRVR